MKLSTKFLRDYLDIPKDITYEKIASDMTRIGNEYDSASKLINATDLVIGEVIDCKMHPDSDHLHVTIVDIGTEKLQIVCGAPNVSKGIKVIVAKPGAVLPEITIKKTVIRGVESNGMLCALFELGLDKKYLHESDINGICILGNDAKVGCDPIKYLGLDDEVIDFELTSNRGDLLSILGMSYEIGALYDKNVKPMETSYQEMGDDINSSFQVKVKTPDCPLFLAKKVNNVEIKESPDFIKERLIASGIRPINNVVDISNFVMLETGQPLHFYDADTLNNELIVRNSKKDEKLVTLDKNERTLSSDDIVIATGNKAIGLAGVMGGLETEITEQTKNIIIESAIFDSIKIRMTSKRILRSEASNRFEKGLDPKRSYLAIERCCNLLERFANATIQTGLVVYDKTKKDDKIIDITFDKINKVLGLIVPREEVINIFKKLQFQVEEKKDALRVTVPSRRIDISIKEDLIEEVGRFYGLSNIVGTLPTVPLKPGKFNKTYREIKHKMASLGLNECLSYTLIKESEFPYFQVNVKEKIKVLSPMTEEHSTLRYSLLASLLNIYDYNKARGINDIHIFEMGNGFYQENGEYKEEMRLAALIAGEYKNQFTTFKFNFYDIKGILEDLLDYLGYHDRYQLEVGTMPKEMHPYQSANIILNGREIGLIGKLNPSFKKDDIYVLEISIKALLENKCKGIQVAEISKYPSILKDVAFVVSKDIPANLLVKEIKRSGGKLLKEIEIFDNYEGEKIDSDKKSLAFKLTFNDFKKTLTDDEVMTIFNKIITDVENKFKCQVRDK